MFLVTNFFSVFIPFWGMLGLWTTRIGYHHRVRIKPSEAENIPIADDAIVGILLLQHHLWALPSSVLRSEYQVPTQSSIGC